MAARIQLTQKNIQELLSIRPEYVISTSEFQDIKRQLTLVTNARRAAPEKSGPTLRRRAGSTQTQEDGSESTKPDQDERPTLRRRNL
jgi:hypothetical protein